MATIGFFLEMKWFLSIACNCNLFISLCVKMFRKLFFHCNNEWIQRSATRSLDWNQVYARKIYPSEVDWIRILNFLLYEKRGETVLKPSTRKDRSSTSSPLSSICLNAPFYCFERVIRPRNSVSILYFFFSLAPFRGLVIREVGMV